MGELGTGKTLFLTFMAYLYHSAGAKLYANYILKNIPYTPIEKLSNLSELSESMNFLAIDEGWLSMDSRRSSSFSNLIMSRGILQSRKRKADVGITAQFYSSVDLRVRGLASYVILPSIHKVDENDKPTVLMIDIYKKKDMDRVGNKPAAKLPIPLHFGGIDICESYDTHEVVDEFDDGRQEYIKEVLEKERYINFDGNKSSLKAFIQVEELKEGNPISSSQASMVANYLKRG